MVVPVCDCGLERLLVIENAECPASLAAAVWRCLLLLVHACSECLFVCLRGVAWCVLWRGVVWRGCNQVHTRSVFGVNSPASMALRFPRWMGTIVPVRQRGVLATVEVQAVVQPQLVRRTVAAVVAAATTEGARVAAPLQHTAALVHF